jgi:hypothetical protein
MRFFNEVADSQGDRALLQNAQQSPKIAQVVAQNIFCQIYDMNLSVKKWPKFKKTLPKVKNTQSGNTVRERGVKPRSSCLSRCPS